VSIVAGALVVAVAFVVMEPVTWATHRFVMHGPGWLLHASHHRSRRRGFEANDVYPVVFASIVMIALWVGFHAVSWRWLVPASVGVTLYGVAYAFVHDGAVHGRLPSGTWFRGRVARLVAAHLVHHRTGGEPFGMLLPFVPSDGARSTSMSARTSSSTLSESGPSSAATRSRFGER
jgi:beta-carotene 3-hydroxylase